MEYDEVRALRERHPAWRLLRTHNAALILSFLGTFFVEQNRGACPASHVIGALDDHLYVINTEHPLDEVGDGDAAADSAALDGSDSGALRYPKEPRAYLEDWSATEAGFLRSSYPPGDEEAHYEVTPAFEKAYSWLISLRGRAFVGTESRLHTVVELLRQIVHGTEDDPEARLAELRRRRAEIDEQIAAVEAGDLVILDATAVRDRYQQFSSTARELLADFREVEDNFRMLDRAAREKITGWDGSKGELLAELVGSRSEISGSDQGRSFQAFYDYLLSQSRQEELADLLRRVAEIDGIDADERMRGVHHDWSEAAERTQRTVRQISEQLRRFLDDQVWLENRRVLDLVRSIESAALRVRDAPPDLGLEVDGFGLDIALPFERPLYRRPAEATVDSTIPDLDEPGVDTASLFEQVFVDQARLAEQIRSLVRPRSTALLSDIIDMYPLERGAAEIVGYLALSEDDIEIELDEDGVTRLEYAHATQPDLTRRVTLPAVTVRRR